MKKISGFIPALFILLLIISCHTKHKNKYYIYSLPLFDAEGNQTINVKSYDHIPTKKDSAEFGNPIQMDKKELLYLDSITKSDSIKGKRSLGFAVIP